VRLQALTSFLFECAFELSTIKGSAFPILPPLECAFEPSPHFFSSAPSSPRPSKVVRFLTLPTFEYALEPSFQHASKPSFPSSFHLLNSAPSSPIKPLLKNPHIFPPGQVTHYNVTIFEKSSYFSHWAGNPLQCDQFEKSSYFSTGQVTHYNVTICEKSLYFSIGPVTHYNVTIFEKSSHFSTGQVTHYNVTTFEKSSYFSTGPVTHYNVTIFLKNPRIFPLGR